MFKMDPLTDEQCTSRRFNVLGGQNFFSEMRGTGNQYDQIGTRNHFQDLNEKFQELECKMFEVEKCFKEANKREIAESRHLLGDNSNAKSPSKIVQNMQYEFSENMKEPGHPLSMHHRQSDITKGWFGDHRSSGTEKREFTNRIGRDGSGDVPRLQSEELSEDSCKTLTKAMNSKSVRHFSGHGLKSIFTINRFDDVGKQRQSPKNYISREENNNSMDAHFLEKSKQLILTLIDKELKKIESKPEHFFRTNETAPKSDIASDAKKNLKIECINNIEKELMTLKKLESLDQ